MPQQALTQVGWSNYLDGLEPAEHTITGTVLIQRGVFSPQLGNTRDLTVYLPPSYDHSDQRYPVLYMHDGQNLFDAAASFAGEWRVDEAIDALSREGMEAIVVGIANTPDRMKEYVPFRHPYFGGGRGDTYLNFVFDTVKPQIDAAFRTLPDAAHTGMAGSSLGGLITLYAFFRQPTRLSFAGVLSPSLWIARTAIQQWVEAAPAPRGKIYLDIGAGEFSENMRRRFKNPLADHQALADLLERKGYPRGQHLMYVEDPDGKHTEADWARRFPMALRFWLG